MVDTGRLLRLFRLALQQPPLIAPGRPAGSLVDLRLQLHIVVNRCRPIAVPHLFAYLPSCRFLSNNRLCVDAGWVKRQHVVILLEVVPELGARSERLPEQVCGSHSDGAFSVNDFADCGLR